MAVPEWAKKSDGEPLPWPRVVAKLMAHGLPIEHIRKMTLYQAVSTMDELTEEMKWQARLAGADIPEEDKEATLQDLLGFGM
jgi:hypothetical protein